MKKSMVIVHNISESKDDNPDEGNPELDDMSDAEVHRNDQELENDPNFASSPARETQHEYFRAPKSSCIRKNMEPQDKRQYDDSDVQAFERQKDTKENLATLSSCSVQDEASPKYVMIGWCQRSSCCK